MVHEDLIFTVQRGDSTISAVFNTTMVDGVKDTSQQQLDPKDYQRDFPRLPQMQQEPAPMPPEALDRYEEAPTPTENLEKEDVTSSPTLERSRSILLLDKVFPKIELKDGENFKIVGEIIVASDKQRKYLGGNRTFFESLTADAFVDVAVRDVSVDLFGFALDYAFQDAVEAYRQNQDHKVLLIDPGDLTDSGCQQEMYIAWHKGQIPDHKGKGNHDGGTHQGNLSDDSNAFGIMSHFLGKTPTNDWTYRKDVWGSRCSDEQYILESQDHDDIAAVAVYGYESPDDIPWIHLKRVNRQAAVVNTDDGKQKVSWGSLNNARLLFENEDQRNFISKGMAQILEPDTNVARQDAVRVYKEFWRKAPNGKDVAYVKMDNPNLPQERQEFSISAEQLSDDIWYINFNSMDMTKSNRTIPGLQGTVSYTQTYLIQAYMGYILSEINPNAIFVGSTHFYLENMYNPLLPLAARAWKKSDLPQLLSQEQILATLTGHAHSSKTSIPNQEFSRDKSGIHRNPAHNLYNFRAASFVDDPIQGMRIVFVEIERNGIPHIIPLLDNLPLNRDSIADLPKDVSEEVNGLRNDMGSYRDVYIEDKRIRGIIHNEGLGKYLQGVNYLLTPGENGTETNWEVIWHDTIPLMVYQYFEIIKYTKSVILYLENEDQNRKDFEQIQTVLAELKSHVADMETNFDKWHRLKYLPAKQKRDEYEDILQKSLNRNDLDQKRDEAYNVFKIYAKEALSLTNMDCQTPHNHKFAGDDIYFGCIGKLQLALEDIPADTEAFKFMLDAALEGAKQDHLAKDSAWQHYEPKAIPLE